MRKLLVLACLIGLLSIAQAQTDPLPSWNDGPPKQAILEFVRVTTDKTNRKYVATEERIAAFDQDGTTWVSHPIYTQVVFCLDRVPVVVAKKPELNRSERARLVRDQYEKRLEADVRFRETV